MDSDKNPLFLYARVLEPWTRLAISAPGVISLRMGLLPWLWLTNPGKAHDEVQRMFSEKNDAWHETAVALSQAPIRFWFDTFAAIWSPDPAHAFSRAMVNSSHRMATPSTRRVNANHKRLSGSTSR